MLHSCGPPKIGKKYILNNKKKNFNILEIILFFYIFCINETIAMCYNSRITGKTKTDYYTIQIKGIKKELRNGIIIYIGSINIEGRYT